LFGLDKPEPKKTEKQELLALVQRAKNDPSQDQMLTDCFAKKYDSLCGGRRAYHKFYDWLSYRIGSGMISALADEDN
jgi:hypothetical protein